MTTAHFRMLGIASVCRELFSITQIHASCEHPCLEPPKSFLGVAKISPWGFKIGFGRTKIERKAFCRVQQLSRRVQDVPRARQERPKSAPRAPRAPRQLFNVPPRATKWAPRVLPRVRGELLGTILRPPILTEAPFARDLSRDALKTGF